MKRFLKQISKSSLNCWMFFNVGPFLLLCLADFSYPGRCIIWFWPCKCLCAFLYLGSYYFVTSYQYVPLFHCYLNGCLYHVLYTHSFSVCSFVKNTFSFSFLHCGLKALKSTKHTWRHTSSVFFLEDDSSRWYWTKKEKKCMIVTQLRYILHK